MSQEKELSEISFFISSTYTDLKEHRSAIISRIKGSSGIIHSQEFFGSRPDSSLTTCLEELNKSDVFILILAHRYGSISEDSDKSFTEIEYEKAIEQNKLILAYIIDDQHPWPPEFVDKEQYKRNLDFRNKVMKRFTVDRFTTPGDLADKVMNDLVRELPKRSYKIGNKDTVKTEESNKEIIEKFNIVPKLYNHRNLILSGTLGEYSSVSENICDAMSITYGASISREFSCSDESLKEVFRKIGPSIYATDEKAIQLMDLSADKEYTFSLRTVYGYYYVEKDQEELVDRTEFEDITKIGSSHICVGDPYI